jgi:hypothetical protein
MPSRRRRGTKKSKKRVSVTVIAAIIGAIGAVIAAIVGIYPDLFGLAHDKNLTTATPVSFSRYDDPYGMYSIEYPSNFVYLTRNQNSKNLLLLLFVSREALENNNHSGQVSAVGVTVAYGKEYKKDNNLYANDLFLKNLIQGNLGDQYLGKSFLVSNETTAKGYRFHYRYVSNNQSPSEIEVYALFEVETEAMFSLVYVSAKPDENVDREVIEHMYANFSWDPSKVNQYFNP